GHVVHTGADDENAEPRFGERVEVGWGDGPHVKRLSIVDQAYGETVGAGLDLDLKVAAPAPVRMKDDVVERFAKSRDDLVAPFIGRVPVAVRMRTVLALDELAGGRDHAHREVAIFEQARQLDTNHLSRPRLGEFYLIFSYDGGQKRKIAEPAAPKN